MKKIFFIVSICLLMVSGCGQTSTLTVNVHEETFIEQMEHIISNVNYFLGKKIEMEGVYTLSESPFHLANNYTLQRQFVSRYVYISPGEKYFGQYFPYGATGGSLGFLIIWNNQHPEQYSWVRVIGVLEKLETFNEITGDVVPVIFLNLSSLTVLDERGLETVVR